MKVLWICGLPDAIRQKAYDKVLSPTPTASWSWILGHLPPPNNIELHILCPVGGLYADRVDFDYMGAHWHCVRLKRFEICFLWYRFFLYIRPLVKSLKPDVIQGWGGETGYGRLATLISKNAIVSVQGLLAMLSHNLLTLKHAKERIDLRTRLTRLCERKAYRSAKLLLVESEASRCGLLEFYGERGQIVPHPLRDEFLTADLSVRQKLSKSPVKFVYVGSLIERKGAIDVVVAFAASSRKDTKLVMIGDGEAKSKIETIIQERGMKDRVVIKGVLPADKIVDEFKNVQFFILPSYGDTGPTALKEALACGLYPICYDNSGPRDLISRYGCGTLVKTADIGCLSVAIDKCISKIEDCVQDGLSAAPKVRNDLSRNNVWEQLFNIYKANICFS